MFGQEAEETPLARGQFFNPADNLDTDTAPQLYGVSSFLTRTISLFLTFAEQSTTTPDGESDDDSGDETKKDK